MVGSRTGMGIGLGGATQGFSKQPKIETLIKIELKTMTILGSRAKTKPKPKT